MKKIQVLLAGIVSLLMVTSANAALTVQLSETADFSGTVISATDLDGDGLVTVNSPLGGWIANVSTGISSPMIGDEYTEQLHLNSVNVSGGTGTIYIRLIEDAMTKNVAPYIATVGGTTDGSVSFLGTASDGITTATLFDQSYGTGAFSGTNSGDFALSGDYTAILYAAISHESGFAVSSFDFDVKVPEPGSLALLGLGLIGLGFVARRRK